MKIFQKKKPRPLFIGCRVSEEEYVLIVEAAERAGVGLSYFYREVLLSAIQSSKARSKTKTTPGEVVASLEVQHGRRAIAEQLKRIGINLNQIAHVMNMLKIPHPPELVQVLKEISHYMQFVWATEGKALTDL